jgi:hypothetical protein
MAKIEMPKNSSGNPEVDVIAEDITTALARIDWLLNGNIDADNIVAEVSGASTTPFLVPASKVQDIPLISNEIQSTKIMRNEAGNNTFSDMVWSPIKNAVNKNPVFAVLSSTLFMPITKDTQVYDNAVYVEERKLELEHFEDTDIIYRARTRRFNKTIFVEIPPTHTPVYFKEILDLFGYSSSTFNTLTQNNIDKDDLAVNFELFIESFGFDTTKKTTYLNVRDALKPTFDPKSMLVSFDIFPVISGVKDLEEEDFLNINIKISVLCKERV